MRSSRDTVIVWTVSLIVAVGVMVAVAFVAAPAGAHRVVSNGWAQRSANYYVRSHYCGRTGGWSCTSVWAPVLRCGMHSWCWHGVSYRECVRVPWWGCIKHRSRSSSGTINGHTGGVTGYGSW